MRFRVAVLVVCATALVAAAGAGTAAAGAARHSVPSAAATWAQATAAGLPDDADIGLVRGTNGVLHVIWTNGAMGSVAAYDTPVQPGGAVGQPVVITAHLNQATFPDATGWAGELHAFWNEISNAGNKFTGTAVATWPAGGSHWDPVTGVTPALNDFWGFGVAASTGADGKPWVAFTDEGGFEVLHFGHAKRQINVSACCVYNPGIGVDDSTAATWLTWYSNITGQTGIYAQQLTQNGSKVGAAIRLPGSETGGNAIQPNQRTTATGLGPGKPGVYVSYLRGYPSPSQIDVIRLGSRAPVVAGTLTGGASGTTLAADPAGRLWVAWYRSTSGHSALFVRRAAAAASQFGAVQRVPLPPGTADLWKAYINAQAGRLDVLALLTVHGKIAYWATQVLPPS
jgi:hypothetical protein